MNADDCSTEVHPLSGRYFTVACSCGWNTIVFGYADAGAAARQHTNPGDRSAGSRENANSVTEAERGN